MSMLNDFFSLAVMTLLGISGVLFVTEALGFLPRCVSRWINRNRLTHTMSVLREFGIDDGAIRRRNHAAKLDQTPSNVVSDRVESLLAEHKLDGPISVGHTLSLRGNSYVDLMGATCRPETARVLARDLAAHWRSVITDRAKSSNDRFDFVATPKSGSPLLGAAFADHIGKPLVLHVNEPKYEGGDRFRALFDCYSKPEYGAIALVLDDSSTGGGKAAKLVEDLRSQGYKVYDMLVVFEPSLKREQGVHAAARLEPLNVRIHSIIET